MYIHLQLKISIFRHGLCIKIKVFVCWCYRISSLLVPTYISSKHFPCVTFRSSCRGCCVMMILRYDVVKPPTEMMPIPSILYANDGPLTSAPPLSHLPHLLHWPKVCKQNPALVSLVQYSWATFFTRDAASLQGPENYQSVFSDPPQVLSALLKISGDSISIGLSWRALATNWEEP